MNESFQEITQSLTVFDIVALAVITLFGVRCLMRGFVKEVFSLAGIIGAVVLGRLYYQEAAEFFKPWVPGELQSNVLGFAAIALGVLLSASLASWLVFKLIHKTFLAVADRLGGLAVGILQGGLVMGIFLMVVVSVTGSLEKSFVADSVLAPYLLEFVRFLSGIILKQSLTPDKSAPDEAAPQPAPGSPPPEPPPEESVFLLPDCFSGIC